MPLWPTTHTYAELKREVQRAFGDESGVQLEDQDIIDFANAGQVAINEENAILKARSTATSVVGQRMYTFPDMSISRIESIMYNGRILPSMPYQEAQDRILEVDPEGLQTGKPVWWFSFGTDFWLWPTPDDGGTIEVMYTRTPEKLTGDPNQELGVPDRWYEPLRDYVLQRAYEMDQDWQAAAVKAEQFRTKLASFSEFEAQSQHGSFPVIREV